MKDTLAIYLVDQDDLSQPLLDHGKPGTAIFVMSGSDVVYLTNTVH